MEEGGRGRGGSEGGRGRGVGRIPKEGTTAKIVKAEEAARGRVREGERIRVGLRIKVSCTSYPNAPSKWGGQVTRAGPKA